ncbi:MAG: hypothetical protein H7X71_08330, partial [Chitinophagales bacterium]|nr:hypothetical protein [Chitinophagales bacterium]
RILQNIEIPKSLLGMAATICFELLADINEPVAIRCFSMTVLANISEKEPDIKNELRLLIEEQLPFGTAGFKSRARKVLKSISS